MDTETQLYLQQKQIDELVHMIRMLTGNYGINYTEVQKSLDYIRKLKTGLIDDSEK